VSNRWRARRQTSVGYSPQTHGFGPWRPADVFLLGIADLLVMLRPRPVADLVGRFGGGLPHREGQPGHLECLTVGFGKHCGGQVALNGTGQQEQFLHVHLAQAHLHQVPGPTDDGDPGLTLT
jgi:hypothetical protein